MLRVRVGFTLADAQQRVPTIECFHGLMGGGEALRGCFDVSGKAKAATQWRKTRVSGG